MELKFNVKGKERKLLVSAISEILNQPTEYAGVPSCKYTVGGYEIDRDSTVTGEDNIVLRAKLAERGFETIDILGMEDSAETAPKEPETAENAVTNCLTIEFPLEGFTPEKRIHLEQLVESKDILIKEVLGIDELPIKETDHALQFPWFPADSEGEAVNAYAQFITALCDTAKTKRRVMAKPQESFENPRFSMRVWLISLGLIGREFELCRKLMMNGLSGNSAYRYEKPITIKTRRPQNDDIPQE